MATVEIYSSGHCPYCIMAKQLLDRKGVTYTEIRIDLHSTKRQEMLKRARQRTVPQIFINNKPVGGYTDLLGIDRSDRLDSLLAQS